MQSIQVSLLAGVHSGSGGHMKTSVTRVLEIIGAFLKELQDMNSGKNWLVCKKNQKEIETPEIQYLAGLKKQTILNSQNKG